MITNADTVDRFERILQKTKPMSIAERFALLEGMYEHAITFNGFRPGNEDEHLLNTIQLVRNLHSLVQTPSH